MNIVTMSMDRLTAPAIRRTTARTCSSVIPARRQKSLIGTRFSSVSTSSAPVVCSARNWWSTRSSSTSTASMAA